MGYQCWNKLQKFCCLFILELDFGAIKGCVFALLTVIPNHIIDELIKVQTDFICKNTPAKIALFYITKMFGNNFKFHSN